MPLFSKRDLEMLKYQRELMRKAALTAPAITLSGPDIPIIRRFAQETLMMMRAYFPEKFEGKTIDDWEKAIKAYVTSRRPEMREELLKQLRARYASQGGKGTPPPPPVLLASEATKGMEKKATRDRKPRALEYALKGALYGAGGGALMSSPAAVARFLDLKKAGTPPKKALIAGLKSMGTGSVAPGLAGVLGGLAAYPFAKAVWEHRQSKRKRKK